MRQIDVVIIGAGQAGLATSHCLSRLGVDHLLLERGDIAERWRSERWEFTPSADTELDEPAAGLGL